MPAIAYTTKTITRVREIVPSTPIKPIIVVTEVRTINKKSRETLVKLLISSDIRSVMSIHCFARELFLLLLLFSIEAVPRTPNANTPNTEVGSETGVTRRLTSVSTALSA